MKQKVEAFLPWILLLAISLIWGSSFILIKKGLQVFSAGELGALRISMAFLSLTPIAITHIPKQEKGKIACSVYSWNGRQFCPGLFVCYSSNQTG